MIAILAALPLAFAAVSNTTVAAGSSTANATESGSDVYVTEVVTAFTTYCPEATTFTQGNKTYTVTAPTTLTITDCPCTITTTSAAHNSTKAPAETTSSKAPAANGAAALAAVPVLAAAVALL